MHTDPVNDNLSDGNTQYTLSELAVQLKATRTRRPRGYLQNPANIQIELERYTEILNHTPTYSELKILDPSLASTICRDHGGYSKTKTNLGYELLRKPRNYWKSRENLVNELEEIVETLGHFPNEIELEGLGKSSIAFSVQKYHGGLRRVAHSMGYKHLNIGSKEAFIRFLKDDFLAMRLSLLAINTPDIRFDLEWLIVELCDLDFSNGRSIHRQLEDSRDEINDLATSRIMGYNPKKSNRGINLNLLEDAIDKIPDDLITDFLLLKLVKILTREYNPMFREDPDSLLREIKNRELFSEGKKRTLYSALWEHYDELNLIRLGPKFVEFLNRTEVAKKLAGAALSIPHFRPDLEQLIIDIYHGEQTSKRSLHTLLDQNDHEILELARSISENNNPRFSRTYILEDGISMMPDDLISDSIESRLSRILIGVYYPEFNLNPDEVMAHLNEKANSTKGKSRKIFKDVIKHYKQCKNDKHLMSVIFNTDNQDPSEMLDEKDLELLDELSEPLESQESDTQEEVAEII
jgi:hypothetical protein